MSALLAWCGFLACAVAILVSGSRLARFGDVVAERTGLGRTWAGLVLLATATSLPELVSGISASAVVGAPDIAVGNAIGACIVNLAIIAVLDFFHPSGPILGRVDGSHQLTAAFGLILFAIIGLSVAAAGDVLSVPGLGVALPSVLILAIYVLAVRLHYLAARRAGEEVVGARPPLRYGGTGLGSAYAGYAINAAVILAAGTLLPWVGQELARMMQWEEALVGSVLLALTTTMPEAVTSAAALRLGATDLAVANLLGSNLFNASIVAIDDIAYRPGPIFASVSPVHMTSVLVAMALTALVLVGLSPRAEGKTRVGVSGECLAILGGYSLYLVWFWSGGAR